MRLSLRPRTTQILELESSGVVCGGLRSMPSDFPVLCGSMICATPAHLLGVAPNGICTRATALKGRSKCLRDLGERGHLGSDQGFRLSASLDVSRRFPLSRASYAPQGSRL